jgi:hypothetical protein
MFKPHTDKEEEVSEAEDNIDYVSVKRLPSNFLAYPDDVKISYKTYRWGDVKRVSSTKYEEKTLIPFISLGIKVSSIAEPEFQINDLTLSDFLYIGLLRKLSTFGTEKFRLSTACVKCDSEITKEIPWNKLEFDELEMKKLPVMLTLTNGALLKFNPLTVKHYLELLEEEAENDEIKAMFKSLVGKSVISYENFHDLPLDDGRDIDEINDILYHGLEDIICECPKCEYKNRVSVDGKETLLRPAIPSQEAKASRIHVSL